jgi:hypothetical protein
MCYKKGDCFEFNEEKCTCGCSQWKKDECKGRGGGWVFEDYEKCECKCPEDVKVRLILAQDGMASSWTWRG